MREVERTRRSKGFAFAGMPPAGDFIQFAKSSQDLFNSLEQLTLPPIELFNDAAIQQEFIEITKKLKED